MDKRTVCVQPHRPRRPFRIRAQLQNPTRRRAGGGGLAVGRAHCPRKDEPPARSSQRAVPSMPSCSGRTGRRNVTSSWVVTLGGPPR